MLFKWISHSWNQVTKMIFMIPFNGLQIYKRQRTIAKQTWWERIKKDKKVNVFAPAARTLSKSIQSLLIVKMMIYCSWDLAILFFINWRDTSVWLLWWFSWYQVVDSIFSLLLIAQKIAFTFLGYPSSTWIFQLKKALTRLTLSM